jgi:hypothetical protein
LRSSAAGSTSLMLGTKGSSAGRPSRRCPSASIAEAPGEARVAPGIGALALSLSHADPAFVADTTVVLVGLESRLGGGRIAGVTTKERLHKLVDELSEQEADDALRYIAERREDPMIAAFRDAPEDDEPPTAAEEEALAEVQADRAAGVPRISYAEIKRKHDYP